MYTYILYEKYISILNGFSFESGIVDGLVLIYVPI
jgi:hypothetical protein